MRMRARFLLDVSLEGLGGLEHEVDIDHVVALETERLGLTLEGVR